MTVSSESLLGQVSQEKEKMYKKRYRDLKGWSMRTQGRLTGWKAAEDSILV